MAYNDYDVLVYRVLRYLYECLKDGKQPSKEDIYRDCQMCKIPKAYRDTIFESLIDEGYVKGISYCVTKDGMHIDISDDTRITASGIRFINENSKMAEVKAFLGQAFEIAVHEAVSALIPW